MSKVSVIIACRNAEKTLRQAVRSVLSQEGVETEVLIVDDGSGEETKALEKELAGESSEVRLLSSGGSGRGVSSARNTGLKSASGEYVTFLDADDMFMPGMLKYLVRIASENDAPAAGCGFFSFADGTSPGGRTPDAADYPVRMVTAEDYVRKELLYGNTRCWSKIYRRELVENTRFRADITIGEDMLFVLSLLKRAGKLALSDAPFYAYRDNAAGAMKKPYVPSYMDQVRCWDEAEAFVKKHFPSLNGDEALERSFARVGMISAMLVAGKLAMLSPSDRKKYEDVTKTLRDKIRTLRGVKGAFAELPPDYRIKCTVFEKFPRIYYRTYGPYKGIMTE